MNQPLISVCVPVYNVENYLNKCLDSILSQSYQNIELIVVDDGSTDSSKTILKQYVEKDSRVKLISQDNQGHQKARHVAVSNTTGDYLAFVDSDDSLEPNALQSMVELIVRESADIVVGRLNIESNGKKKMFRSDIFSTISFDDYLREYLLSGRVGWNMCGKLFKTKLIKDNGEAPIKVAAGEDALFTILLVAKNKGLVTMLNQAVYNYFVRPNSITHTRNVSYIYDNFKVADYVENFLEHKVASKFLVAFRLLCYSNSFRYGWLGQNHSLYIKTFEKLKKNKDVIPLLDLKKRIFILSLVYKGDFLSKYIFKNKINEESTNN